VAKSRNMMAKVEDIDAMLDRMGIAKGKAREKVKTYCSAKVNSAEGKCMPSDELSLLVHGYFDGYSEALRGG
jgi:hypothetical protein